ncbi:MAG: SDR family oxidoreductase [Lachnospiraceae bacterium]|nr:SDR family oxidoreductase [Lachnospiraceae bacterium]
MKEKMLAGRRALVTGGSSGIGRAVALTYAREGADVVICATNPEKLKKVEGELLETGVKVLSLVCDVGDPEQVGKTVRAAEEFLGGIDILANIAGMSPKKEGGFKIPFYELTTEQWNRVMDVNLNSMFYFSRAVAPGMMERKYGRIVNMSSIVGLTNSEHGPAAACYSTSKTGAIGLTKAMAYELAPYGITVNAVAGGRIATEMSAANNSYYNDLHMKLIPMKRFGTTEEVAHVFVFYASEEASYVTGDTCNITGGWYI